MTEETTLAALRLNVGLCPACNGNDTDAPCAYPSEGKQGCLRDKRKSLGAELIIAVLKHDIATGNKRQWFKGHNM